MTKERNQSEFNIYHVMNRGTGKQLIFEDDWDRKAFLKLLSETAADYDIKVLCWCLMGNHFHLLVQGLMNDVSSAMRDICAGYAKRFNKRHDRPGHLFQGRFSSQAINDEAYLLTVVRYIHQNPIRGGLSSTCDYPWSSYREYIGLPCPAGELCDKALVEGAFDSIEDFAFFHQETVEAKHTESDNKAIEAAERILGDGMAGKLKELDKRSRNAALAKLKAAGLSIRQIQRITGIGKNIIARAK